MTEHELEDAIAVYHLKSPPRETAMTENQKRMLFCIEVLRNRDKKFIEQNPEYVSFAEPLLEYFLEEIGQTSLYEALSRQAVSENKGLK